MLPLFVSPWAFAALLALPTLAGLYWLRNSYRQVPVSSLMLWRDAVESRASGLKVKRLRTPLLFFLELAILALLAMAATGPRLEIAADRPPLVVILDDTYSMLAGKDVSPRAKAMLAMQEEIGWGGTVRFVLAGSRPQSLGGAIDNWTEARDILEDWRCQSPVASIPDATAFAAELGGDRARLLVITDHAPPREIDPGRVVWRAFGESRANHAILRASRTVRENADRVALGLANFSDEPHEIRLVVETREPVREIASESLDLKPREIRQVAVPLPGGIGPVRVRLVADDALAIDNEAFLVADEPPPIRVDLRIDDQTMRDLFDKALQATGRTLPPGPRPQLVVTDAAEMPTLDSDTWIVQVLQEKDAEPYIGPFVLDRTHPLTDGLHLAGIVWGAGKASDVGGPIIMAGNVSLVSDVESSAGQHRIRVRLRADLSTLQQSPNWPILMWNLISWRGRELPGLERVNLRLGDAAILTTRTPAESTIVTDPDGQSRTLPTRGSRLVIPAPKVGFHEVRHAGATHRFSISASSADESDLKHAVTGQWGEWIEDVGTVPGVFSFAWLLLLIALAVLVAHQMLASRT